MPDRSHNVLKQSRPSKEDVRDKLAADWGRCFPPSIKGSSAEAIGCSVSTLNNAITGHNLPELHTALASLLVDPTALQSVLALYGVKAVPLLADAANDLATVAGLSHLSGKWIEALADGRRDHRETCDLANAIRPLLVALSAVVAEADRVRAA